MNSSKITIISFGKMHGKEPDLDIKLSARHLPNPHFVPGMKEISGVDPKVLNWVAKKPATTELIEKMLDLIQEREGDLTVGFVCHGGYHRSVACAELLHVALRMEGYTDIKVIHRDIGKR